MSADDTVGVTLSDLSLEETTGNSSDDGGGLSITNQSSLTLQSVRIRQHQGQGKGAGIYLSNSSLTLIEVKLVDNQATLGGGIYSDDAELLITESLINRNQAGSGGALYVTAGLPPRVDQNDIYNNHATQSGEEIFYNGTQLLSARNNYWGVTELNLVESRFSHPDKVELGSLQDTALWSAPPTVTINPISSNNVTEEKRPTITGTTVGPNEIAYLICQIDGLTANDWEIATITTGAGTGTVSYTHLTLPTNREV